MRTRTTTATLLAVTLLLVGCSSEPSYDESADQCIAAVKALPKGARLEPRPKECERLEEKDYSVIFANKIAGDMGWTDANGRPDLNKMITSTPTP